MQHNMKINVLHIYRNTELFPEGWTQIGYEGINCANC